VSTPDGSGHEAIVDRWWLELPTERFWLEVSDRGADLGLDLNAPAGDENGDRFWSYDLVDEVADGDVVLHYDRSEHAIVAWSVGVGSAWPDAVVWAARGTSAREKHILPHERPGRRHALRGPFALATQLSLSQIRTRQAQLVEIRGKRKYFPFELGRRATRPMQGYLFKLPSAFLELFPELNEVPRGDLPIALAATPPAMSESDMDADSARPVFRPRNEEVRSRRAEPWSRDPSEVDRGLSTHARIERLVAEAAAAAGWTARGYGKNDPVFDLLLERSDGRDAAVVVEAKSTTPTNEERQLRLALGQVLRYQQLLQRSDRKTVAMIAVEQPPRDRRWLELCAKVGVTMVWPEIVGAELARL
jgi:hypothetical protein